MVETSKNLSMKGWKPQVWLKRNKDSIKSILSLLLGLVGAGLGKNVFMATLFGSTSAVGTRIALDTFDYFVSEVNTN